jgi:hypothetical protein
MLGRSCQSRAASLNSTRFSGLISLRRKSPAVSTLDRWLTCTCMGKPVSSKGIQVTPLDGMSASIAGLPGSSKTPST